MAPLLLFLTIPATLLATAEAVGLFRGLRPLPMPFPMIPLVHPMHMIHRMPLPFMHMPHGPVMPIRTRPIRTGNRGSPSEARAVPISMPVNDRQGDVIVVINDRDCFSGLCRQRGYMDNIDMDMMGRGRGHYNIHDADHVVIGNGGRY